jgi:hypothetical protein
LWKLVLGLVVGLATYWLAARRWLMTLQRELRERYWNGGAKPRGRHVLGQPVSSDAAQIPVSRLLMLRDLAACAPSWPPPTSISESRFGLHQSVAR